MERLVFATNNAHKLQEAKDILGDKFEIISLAEIGCFDDIPETADTLEGNARIKALWVKEKYGYDCFADDTGLMVDALDGAPGVYSARYAGPGHNAKQNMAKLLSELQGIEERSAHFSTIVALVRGDNVEIFEGRVDGWIAEKESGSAGFGYDPVFVVAETGRTFAEMGEDAKNAVSHRGRALRKMAEKI